MSGIWRVESMLNGFLFTLRIVPHSWFKYSKLFCNNEEGTYVIARVSQPWNWQYHTILAIKTFADLGRVSVNGVRRMNQYKDRLKRN